MQRHLKFFAGFYKLNYFRSKADKDGKTLDKDAKKEKDGRLIFE